MHYGVGAKGLIKSIDYLKSNYSSMDFPVLSEVTTPEASHPTLKNYESVLATCTEIAAYSYHEILGKGDTPLLVAGDHSSAIGSVSATAAAYEEIGLIWVDAHPDINTDESTVTGNIHGIPVSALLGNVSPAAAGLSRILTDRPKLRPENIVMLGLRDIDPPEADILDELGIKYYTYNDVKNLGLAHCLLECVKYLSHLKAVHLSFDIDSVNPDILPGVSVPVPDGFTIEEVYTVFDALLSGLPVKAIDIVEFNAEFDEGDVTADFTHELVKHLCKYLGK